MPGAHLRWVGGGRSSSAAWSGARSGWLRVVASHRQVRSGEVAWRASLPVASVVRIGRPVRGCAVLSVRPTMRSSGSRFAAPLNLGVRPQGAESGIAVALGLSARRFAQRLCASASVSPRGIGLRSGCPASVASAPARQGLTVLSRGRPWLRRLPADGSRPRASSWWLREHPRQRACVPLTVVACCGLTVRSSRRRFVTQTIWQVELAIWCAPLRGAA